MPLEDKLSRALESRAERSLLRRLTLNPLSSHDFSSNDFLGLARSPLLQELFLRELESFEQPPLGSTGSRLLDGNSTYIEELECRIAHFHSAKSALIFNSGFDANSAFFACVPQKGDVIIYDELIHASVHEGMKLTRASSKLSFAHNDIAALEILLARIYNEDVHLSKEDRRNVFISVESLYSMDGDIAPLQDIVGLLKRFWPSRDNGYLVVDEAHATGVFGSCGRGIVSQLGLEDDVFARLHTFGKALASGGAALLCTPTTRFYLINYARPLIYSTAPPFSTLAATKCSYILLESGATLKLQSHLHNLIAQFRTSITRTLSPSILLPAHPQSPIQGIVLHGPEPVRALAANLQCEGFIVKPICFPTVPKGRERVRICLHAHNTIEQVDGLVRSIKASVEKMNRSETGSRL